MATHVLQLLKMVQLKYGVTMICKFFFWSFHMIYIVYLLSVISDFPKTVGPSVLTDRIAVGPTISQYISDRMSGKTDIWKDRRLKFIPSQFPLPMALNSVFSFIKMSDRDLKFVYLFCQTDTFLFVIETPIQMYVNVNILLVGTSTCKTWNIKTEIYYWAQK
jgi:hypothetical protein